MSWKINVNFLTENTHHGIYVDPELTVLQFKEVLRQQIPFLKEFSRIPTEVLKLSLEGFHGGLMGNVMEDSRSLSTYPLMEERHPVLLSLERPEEKIYCPCCGEPFVQWSCDRLCCGDASQEEDQEKLEKRKARIPQLLNCGHSMCLECLAGRLATKENRLAKGNASADRDREKRENVRNFVCPVEGCGMVTYWRNDQKLQAHEDLQKLVHLKKREWTEAKRAEGICFFKPCCSEPIFRCAECQNIKFCVTHYRRNHHQYDDAADHIPLCLLSDRLATSASDIIPSRFCCYCGGGETEFCFGRAGRPHCEHGDSSQAKGIVMTKNEVTQQQATLGSCQKDCWRQLGMWNGVLDRLQEHRVKGVKKIRKEFDDLISRLEARKEDMVAQLRQGYREKELEVLEKITALGKLSGEVETGLLFLQSTMKSKHNPQENYLLRGMTDINALRGSLSRAISEVSLNRFAEISISFSQTQEFETEFCQMFCDTSVAMPFCSNNSKSKNHDIQEQWISAFPTTKANHSKVGEIAKSSPQEPTTELSAKSPGKQCGGKAVDSERRPMANFIKARRDEQQQMQSLPYPISATEDSFRRHNPRTEMSMRELTSVEGEQPYKTTLVLREETKQTNGDSNDGSNRNFWSSLHSSLLEGLGKKPTKDNSVGEVAKSRPQEPITESCAKNPGKAVDAERRHMANFIKARQYEHRMRASLPLSMYSGEDSIRVHIPRTELSTTSSGRLSRSFEGERPSKTSSTMREEPRKDAVFTSDTALGVPNSSSSRKQGRLPPSEATQLSEVLGVSLATAEYILKRPTLAEYDVNYIAQLCVERPSLLEKWKAQSCERQLSEALGVEPKTAKYILSRGMFAECDVNGIVALCVADPTTLAH